MESLKNQDFMNNVINEKQEYVAPKCKCIHLELSIIATSDTTEGSGASSFEDGGRYGRSLNSASGIWNNDLSK